MSKQTKKTLYIGLNDKDSKTQKIDTIEAYKIVYNTVLQFADGCTIYNATGIYKHADGTHTIEQSLKVELFDINDSDTQKIIATLKMVLNQESIILQVDIVTSQFC